jgi:hypothetical protein
MLANTLLQEFHGTHMCLWQTEHTQSVDRTLYSRHALQTRSLHARQKAPLFMMRPSSARQRAQARPPGLDSSGPQPGPGLSAPLRLRACNSALSLLQQREGTLSFGQSHCASMAVAHLIKLAGHKQRKPSRMKSVSQTLRPLFHRKMLLF